VHTSRSPIAGGRFTTSPPKILRAQIWQPTGAARMVVELSGDIDRAGPPPEGVARGVWVCADRAAGRNPHRPGPTLRLTAASVPSVLPQRRLEQRPSLLAAHFDAQRCLVCEGSWHPQLPARRPSPGVGVAMTRPFHPAPNLVKDRLARWPWPPRVVPKAVALAVATCLKPAWFNFNHWCRCGQPAGCCSAGGQCSISANALVDAGFTL